MKSPATPDTLALDERDCYWAPVEAGRSHPSLETLRYAFEPYLPVSLDEIEARFVRIHGNQWLACGVERERLACLLGEAEEARRIESIRPIVIPEAVLSALGEPSSETADRVLDQFEFRDGTYESPVAKQWKRTSGALATLAFIGLCAMVAWGHWGRASSYESRAATATESARLLAASVTGSEAREGVDPRLRLVAELRRLERTRDASASDLLPPDRTSAFIRVLALMPRDVPLSLDALDIDGGAITFRGRVREASDYETLMVAFSGVGIEWSDPTGSVARAREGYTFTIALRSMEGRP